jgi:hypothetical protein
MTKLNFPELDKKQIKKLYTQYYIPLAAINKSKTIEESTGEIDTRPQGNNGNYVDRQYSKTITAHMI